MPQPYLIALDLDGTLLNDEKTISPKTKSVLKKAKAEGHIVMISTGRPFRSSQPYYNELELDTPIVNFNGAFIHHPKNRSWGIYHEPMPLEVVKSIVETCGDFRLYNIVAEVKDDVYLHYHDEKLLEIFRIGDPNVTTGNLISFLKDEPTSMLIHAAKEDVPEIRKYLSDVHAEVVDHRRWGAPWHIIEIIRAGLNKAVGVKKVADSYGIPKERIIAFGDEDNDMELIEYAGIGIAMGNAIPALKNIADETTLSNTEDGIGVFLEEALNLKSKKGESA
ncbi:5-amino-6-(5-phospho-D-ribitylamino)uracil phosphatase YitU [Weizmannia acidilactici]|uniref:5-amino-6-(5-phospho-D-ribitylamino)uracil phosphatase YitU n=1 Tax=Weizmannia acidilactici TaxID=2607726 RepID=A0A5J4JHV5_9BACI|nr:Cof-type HAD-IIB family hydrolase [Weizmannia acidilactici]GER65750.1 5-amino-6-(5-phospho-D-ribitylamino)uracil phosphatase YitU [Weizmannia acidilactici]GER70879.1 5-amino-6-(5-phospho-D-ribitylamino)uracil phosphatase YitU [Weizmannia acidilactici]GER72654.1 5-amino-6-(5-phospho-D-ribitylamino)uracil phosphatase YitU [Weizmannia acidilactici]